MTAIRITEASGTNGVIQISDSSGSFSSNPKLIFNPITERLGIGTASPNHKVHIVGDMSITGSLFATRYHSTVISASILFESGSSKFGNSTDDVHQFTGSAMFKSGMSGSITHLVDGTSYLAAGSNVTITSASNGQVSISSTGGSSVSRTKNVYFISQNYLAGVEVPLASDNFSSIAYSANSIDLFVNGQMLHTGTAVQVTASSRDYHLNTTSSAKFAFDIKSGDIIDIVTFE